MLVPIQAIFLFAVICCTVGITNSSSADPDDNEEALSKVTGTVLADVASKSSGRFKKTVKSGGKAFNKFLDVFNSAVTTGLDETTAILESGQNLISKKLPEHSKRFRDNLGQTTDALLNHGSNTFGRITTVATGVIKQADELQGTATDELNNTVEGFGNVGKSAIQNMAKVIGKANEMSKSALDTVGNVATNPAKYASATVGYVTDKADTGVSYLKEGANTGLDYLKEGATAINPIRPLQKMASLLPTWPWS